MRKNLSMLAFMTALLAGAFSAQAEPVQNPGPSDDELQVLEPHRTQAAAPAEATISTPTDAPIQLQPVQSAPIAVIVETPPQVNELALGPVGPPKEGEIINAPILDAASRQISFQAVLTDNLGNALAGPVNLRFQVYTSPGGAPVGLPIDVNGVPLNNGIADTQVPVPTSSFDGTGREIGVRVNLGAELAPRIKITAVPYAYRVDRVASEELDDDVTLGRSAAPLASGSLSIQNGGMAQPSIVMTGAASQISTFGSDGLEQIRLWGASYGEILLMDSSAVTNDRTVLLSANGNLGGLLNLYDPDEAIRASLTAPAAGGILSLRNGSTVQSLTLEGSTGRASAIDGFYAVSTIGGIITAKLTDGTGGNLRTYDSTGATETMVAGTSASAGGFLQVKQANGNLGMNVDGDAGTNAGGQLFVYQADGGSGVFLDGDSTGAGLINVNDAGGAARVTIDGESTGTGGEISVFDDDGTETIEMLAAEAAAEGASVRLRRADGTLAIELDSHFVSGAQPDGRIITDELQITGGSDLSEQFDVRAHRTDSKVEPGHVTCIDPQRPGKLVLSTRAYDRTVAGIISGAGGIDTGMYMGQRGSEEADGQFPVALTGRVYVWCDASGEAIEPGDLLTTSNTPGHAMKVSDHSKAPGAVIGKAMTSLPEGKGLVLVLVSLQ